jgi:hypothetical protein
MPLSVKAKRGKKRHELIIPKGNFCITNTPMALNVGD